MIGIFDSGVGGMSVMRAIVEILPQEDIIYFADSANCPYGNRPYEEILHLSQKIVAFLAENHCKVIVAACNTATAAAIDSLRTTHPSISFVGMEPAVKPAVIQSQNKRIAILATKGTFEGRLFREALHIYAQDADIHIIVGEGLVELVEQGAENSPKAISALSRLLQPAISKGIDTLVLGCTHFPFLAVAINSVTNGSVRLVDASMPVALQTKRLLEMRPIAVQTGYEPFYSFYTSGNIDILKQMQEQHLRLRNVRYSVI